jgi:site-specific DNA recombinase
MEDKKTIRVAVYIRVSTPEQSANFSYETQERDLREFVKMKGYKGWVLRDEWIFREQASGSGIERKELGRMMEMAKKKKFDLVLVWKIDRISRSLSDLLGIIQTLDKNDVGFASYKEDMDFSGPVGKLIFQVFGALAEFERSTIKMRTEEGKKTSALAGNYIGGGVPYGYEKIPNKTGKGSKLKLIPKEGEIVKKIFMDYVYEGKGLADIAKELNQLGVPKGKSQRSKDKHVKWLPGRIKVILLNDIYRGSYIANRYKIISNNPQKRIERPREEWIPNEVESVVSESLFFEAQARLAKGERGETGGGKEVYMLSRKLIDTRTHKGFIGYKASKGTKNYRRKKFIDKKTGKEHKTISIAARDLEAFVWSHVEKAVNNPKIFLELHKENSNNSEKRKSLEAEYKICEKSLTKANKRIEAVSLEYFDKKITEDDKDEYLARFETDRDKYYKKVSELERELARLQRYDVASYNLKRFSDNMKGNIDNLSYEQKSNIVKMMVEKIEVSETTTERKAKVFFRFDPKAIASSIPVGRTDVIDNKANRPIPVEGNEITGGR